MNKLSYEFKHVLEIKEQVRELRYFSYQAQFFNLRATEHLSKSTQCGQLADQSVTMTPKCKQMWSNKINFYCINQMILFAQWQKSNFSYFLAIMMVR